MKRILLPLVVLSGWYAGFAQEGTQYPEFPSAREVQPSIQASVRAVGSEFQYEYLLSNGPMARQEICQFIVTVRSPEAYGLQKDRWDLIKKERKGMLQIDWGSVDSLADVMPGGAASPFMIRSVSPPGIIVAYVAGLIPPIAGVEQMEFAPGTGHILYNSAKVSTISPVAPAEPFQRLVFIDSVFSRIVQARALGWVLSDVTARNYTDQFATVRSQLQTGDLRAARASLERIMRGASADSSTALSNEAYALIRFNAEYLLLRLAPSREIKGGLFIVSGSSTSTLTVKARSSVDLVANDTLIALTATLRWPARFNVSLGQVSSSFDVATVDTPFTVGDYRYQRFVASGRYPLSWMAGAEYELLSVPVTGMCGAEEFALTNDIPGSEWYVIVDYVDKTDSVFYSPSALGYAYDNRTNDSYATFANGQRHLAHAQDNLHEIFCSNGEVIYRRSSDDGLTWDMTRRITSGTGGAGSSTVAPGAGGMLYAVWERTLSATSVELWFARSSDNGQSWSMPTALPGCAGLTPGTYQAAHVSPVLAELSSSAPTELVVAFADQAGLKYQRSLDQGLTWMSSPTLVQPTLKEVTDGAYIWSLSMAPGSNYLILTYDYRMLNPELVSRTYTAGSGWSAEAVVCAATGTAYDRYSSVAVDDDDNPVVAWSSQKVVDGQFDGNYRLMLRSGRPTNSWSSFYTEFPKSDGVWDMYPSVGSVSSTNLLARGLQVVSQRSNGEVNVVSKANGASQWTAALLATSGQWVSASLERQSNKATRLLYTDLTGVRGLYPVVVTGTPLSSPPLAGLETSPSGTGEPLAVLARTLVLEDPATGSRLVYGLGPVRCVRSTGDTTTLSFKKPGGVTTLSADTCWNYIGTERTTIPADAQQLLVDLQVLTEYATADTALPGRTSRLPAPQRSEHLFAKNRGYKLQLLDGTGSITVLYQDAQGASLKTSLALPASAKGKALSFRLEGTLSPSLRNKAVVGVGDVLTRK